MREKKIRILCTMLSLTVRVMEKEDYSLAEERRFVLSADGPLFDPEYIDVFVKVSTK